MQNQYIKSIAVSHIRDEYYGNKQIALAVTLNRMKYIRVNVSMWLKSLHTGERKCWKKLKSSKINGKTSLVHALKYFIELRCFPNWSTDSIPSLSSS